MWLLNVDTLELEPCQESSIPEYAILSHTWGDEEITFQDVKAKTGEGKLGWKKVVGCCALAKKDGFQYCWIDTCCIDKSSSSELSEAINSMFKWYKNSLVCYAYLSDVPTWDDKTSELCEKDYSNEEGDSSANIEPSKENYSSKEAKLYWALKRSRWFTRGWTLQELIAPSSLIFYAHDWTEIGTKLSLSYHIEAITGIPEDMLRMGQLLEEYNLATRMSWAAKRETTRTEDLAYCLLGIFNVNMPLLYGEGSRALLRLQQEILLTTDDMTLFAWSIKSSRTWSPCGLLAPSPSYFNYLPIPPGMEKAEFSYLEGLNAHAQRTLLPFIEQHDPPQFSSRGIKATLPASSDMLQLPSGKVAIYCFINDGSNHWCLALRMTRVQDYAGFMRVSRSDRAFTWIRTEHLNGYPTQTLFLHASPNKPLYFDRLYLLRYQVDTTTCTELGIDLRDVKIIGHRVEGDLGLDENDCILILHSHETCLIQVRCEKLRILLRVRVYNNGTSCICHLIHAPCMSRISEAETKLEEDMRIDSSDRAMVRIPLLSDSLDPKEIFITASVKNLPSTLINRYGRRQYQCRLTISSSGLPE